MFTIIVALLVAVLPGMLLGFVLPAGRYRWAAWAAAPALTLGLTALAMAWLRVVGLPNGATAVLVAELGLAGAAVTGSRLALRRTAVDPASELDPPGTRQTEAAEAAEAATGGTPAGAIRFRIPPLRSFGADFAGLAVPSVVTVGFGWLLLGRLVAPPGWDAMNLGYMTRRMLETNSTAITSVCTTGITDPMTSCGFYPLAGNVSWAQAAQLSGDTISSVMSVWSYLIGPLALVAGCYAMMRLLGGRPVVAACAATAPALLGPMWVSTLNGRVNEQLAPCLAAGIALLAALAVRGAHPVRLGLLAGLAGAGLAMTHTYDILFLGALTVGVLIALGGRWVWRTALVGGASIVVAGLVALAPLAGAVLGANGERGSARPQLVGQFGRAVEYWVTDPQRYVLLAFPGPGAGNGLRPDEPAVRIALAVTIVCLLAAPLCLVIPRLRWARPWLLAGVLFTVAGIWTSVDDSLPSRALAGLWYGTPDRVRNMIFPVYGLLMVAGAVGIGTVVARLVARIRRRGGTAPQPRPEPVGTLSAVLVVASLVLIAAVPATWRPLRSGVEDRAPLGDSYVQAFEWLAANTPPGTVVATDRHREFLTWSYPDHGVDPLFGMPPGAGRERDNFARRYEAWNWLVGDASARPAGCLVRRFRIEYVAVSRRYLTGGWNNRPHYELGELVASDRVTRVREFGQIGIYRVTGAGRACPSSGN